MMRTGSVKRFMAEKGFGFISPDDGGPALFAPKRTLDGTETDIKEGAKVEYQQDVESKSNKPFASSWRILGGAGSSMAMPGLAAAAPMAAYPGYAPVPVQPLPGYAAYGAIPAQPLPAYPAYGALPPGYGAAPVQVQAAYGAAPTAGVGVDRASPYGVPAASAPAQLPPGWEQVLDPATQKHYYCNRVTGESSWTPPAAAAVPQVPVAAVAPAPAPMPVQVAPVAAQPAPVAAVAPAPVAAAPAPASLPAGWESATDSATGKTYYFNRATGQTSWTAP